MTQKKSFDFTLMITVLILVIIGIIMVFSSSQYYSFYNKQDSYHFLKKNLLWAIIGIFAMVFTTNFNYKRYKKLAFPAYIFSIVLLVLVLTPLGMNLNGAQRWIKVGPITIMPSEIAKICAIIFVSDTLTRKVKDIDNFFKGIFPYLIIIGLYVLLILKQPNLSTAITIALIIASMLFVAGMRWLHVVMLGASGVGAIIILILQKPYRMKRLVAFLDPFKDPKGDGYQVIQSLFALGSGGLFGVGLGRSIQNKLYIPEPQNDFIFATIGEELGFIGCVTVMLLFLFLIWRGIRIAIHAPDLFSSLMATGITAMIAIQVIINIAVATSSMPVTGIPLPFISFGGNSLAIFMGAIGILLNISKYTENENP
ncbi:stage V sporulation protein E [Paramaledivibacter caminithermalis]|uniref:Probable peptidoglycan glycosyltransferase FtsW n=1 Tax=Paramaledivibacter caminithermalis (strain DSM 15212 / CIP 107654 / DViRD3) TaxID=1121301 RepID=A0A1M6S182_PARC5|nr:stage V sporulation protein E [Paramaledivibacter caminithermalis]SHK38572.1 cell division protein FtsW [Paramaledivibacter caminithermalis DSM 15212]